MSTVMTQRDRTELRRILKARFELLHKQLDIRKSELLIHLEEEIRAQYKEQVAQAKERTSELEAEAQKFAAKADALQKEMEGMGLTHSHYRYEFFGYNFHTDWQPANLSQKIDEAFKKVTSKADYHKVDLYLKQLELEEELAIGALGSEEAKSFLSKIPTVDTLLPMDDNMKKALKS